MEISSQRNQQLIEQTERSYYAERVRHLQKTDSKIWHHCIQVPHVQADRQNEIANAINCKFVYVSANPEALDNCNLAYTFCNGMYIQS